MIHGMQIVLQLLKHNIILVLLVKILNSIAFPRVHNNCDIALWWEFPKQTEPC